MERDWRPHGLFAADGLSPDAQRTAASIASLFGAITLALGFSGVVGWMFDVPVLRHLVADSPAIRPLSAVCLALLGAGLWFCVARPLLSGSLALLAAVLASLSVVESLMGAEAFLRSVLVHPRLLASQTHEIVERLRPISAVPAAGYFALAVALMTARSSRLVVVAQTLAITVLFMALVPVLGFLYQAESLSSPLLSSSPSLIGSVSLTLLAAGILCANPARGTIGLLASDTAGSRAARRLLVPALLLPMLVGGAFVYAREAGSLDLDAAVPAFVCALAATLGGSLLWVARGDARMEILHRRGEEAIRTVVNTSPLMMWMADAHGRGTHVNPALLEFLGRTRETVLGSARLEFIHPDDQETMELEVAAALQARRPFSAEFRVPHTDGSWRWVLSTGMPRFTPTNEISGYTGTWIDVTARKDAEYALQRFASELESRVVERTAALSASKEELARQTGLLQSIVQSMGDAVLAVSLEGEILLSNDAALYLFGASTTDANTNSRMLDYGFFLSDGVTPFPLEELPMIRALSGVSTDNVMMVARHKAAPEGRWVRVTGRPLRDRNGRILGSIVVGRDVTEFEKAVEATRRLAAVVEASGDAILSVSLDGKVLTWNRGAEQMYGYAATEAIGVPFARLDPSLDRDGIQKMLAQQRDRTIAIRRDLSARRRDGSVVDITATMSPIYDEAGTVTALSVVHHDVTHLKAAERRIQALNDELEERVRDRTAALVAANHDLENYAVSVAHDLRTPLRAIAGFARVLEEDYAESVGDEGRRVIGVVRKNAQDMGAFIDALLSFSAVDRQPPNKETVDVAGVVREILDSLGPDCAERDVAFHVGHLPSCRADRASLKQVFINLLANAVKFSRHTDKAHIEIGSSIESSGATSYFVKDNGVGFDMSNTRRLFGLFQRLHAPTDFEGTGLGLASVARIVAAHGGRVWAEAEPGKGARFSFIIDQREGTA
ncbi:MAG: PAS domain S-box protein [Candidatus Binatia bacterium]